MSESSGGTGNANMLLADFGNRGHLTHDVWNFGIDLKTLKLSFVILIYLYANDDGKISFGEKRAFNKLFKSVTQLTDSDRLMFERLLDSMPDRNYVLRYKSENELSDAVFNAALKYIKEYAKLNKKHRVLLGGL